MCVTEEGYV